MSPITDAIAEQAFAGGLARLSKISDITPPLGSGSLHQMELPPKLFQDGSVRPDRLVAPSLTQSQSGISIRGRPVSGNHFGLPRFVMTNAMSNEPHTDSHMHPTNYIQQGLTPKQVLSMMDEIGIRSSTLMPIPTSLQVLEGNRQAIKPSIVSGETGANAHHGQDTLHDCGLESYYIPKEIQEREMKLNGGKLLSIDDFRKNPNLIDEIVQRGELYIDTAVNSHLASQIKSAGLSDAERSRLDPMLTGINLGDLRSGTKLLTELYHNKGVFTGIGEVTVHKELVEEMYAGQRGQANARGQGNRLEGLKNLLEMAGVIGMPVVLHCDIDNLRAQLGDSGPPPSPGRTPTNFEGLREMLADPQVRDTKIIWAHGGGLGRFVQQDINHLERLSELLKECPNLYIDISWSEVAKQINRPDVCTSWINFLEENSTRISFGSDTLAPVSAEKWGETKKMYTDVLAQLSPVAKDNILNHTYENIIVGSRAKVRKFEDAVLTREFYEEHLINPRSEQPLSPSIARDALRAALPEIA